jgi:hypothetical protein
LARGQVDIKVLGSKRAKLISFGTGLTMFARNSSEIKNFRSRNKVMRKESSFDELLCRYQKIAEQKQSNQLEGTNGGILHHQK